MNPDFLALSVVDAQTGELLWRANLTHADAVGTGQAVGMYPGGDVPNGGGDLQPVTFPVFDGTALSGNNAHVFADVNDDDVAAPKDEVPAVTGTDWSYLPQFDTTDASQNCSTHFYCTWDKTVAKDWNRNRSWFGVQLYSFLNTFHDHLPAAPIGFTEAAGNFQATNTSGQGLGGDAVQGHFLDGANTANGFPDGGHVNNANFSTPVDGEPGVMQMYLQRAATWAPNIPSGDSGNEAETVYHEFAHGLSNRLVTTPDGIPSLNAQQSGAMGEGWSDWYAIDFTDNHGWFFDTPANGDAFPFRYSAGDDVVFRTSAADCPVGVAATNCPVRRVRQRPGRLHVRRLRQHHRPARGARRRRDLGADAVGDARAARIGRDGVDRHARHGAVAAGAVVPGHAERDPAGRPGRLRGIARGRALDVVRRARHGLLRGGLGRQRREPGGRLRRRLRIARSTRAARSPAPSRTPCRARRCRACTWGSPVTCPGSAATSAT